MRPRPPTLCLFLLLPPAAKAPHGLPVWTGRAESAVDALLSGFWDPSRGYLTEAVRTDRANSKSTAPLLGYWQYQEAVHAVALAARSNPETYGE